MIPAMSLSGIALTASFVVIGTAFFGEMWRTRSSAFLVTRRWATYAQAVWLTIKACLILVQWEVSTHWRRHLADAQRAL